MDINWPMLSVKIQSQAVPYQFTKPGYATTNRLNEHGPAL